MAKQKAEDITIERSSGNVFADLGLADAEELKIKSGLVVEITRAIHRQKLMECLNRLGYDIEIKIRAVRKPLGRRTLAVA